MQYLETGLTVVDYLLGRMGSVGNNSLGGGSLGFAALFHSAFRAGIESSIILKFRPPYLLKYSPAFFTDGLSRARLL